MKKILSLLLVAALVLSLAVSFTSCHVDGDDDNRCSCDEPTERFRRENVVEATCELDGSYDRVSYCDTCGKDISRERIILPATEAHTADEAVVENETTVDCVKTYDEVVYCVDCGVELSRTLVGGVDAHVAGEPERVDGEPATCIKEGYYYEVVSCTECGEQVSSTRKTIGTSGHSYVSNVCETCGEVDDSWYDTIWWGDDNFIFRLQENSNFYELPSTCARYLAGDTEFGLPTGERAEDIDDMVDIRNAQATQTTKITPIFTYITENEDKGWSKNINDMVYDMSNFIPGITPDAYCNFVYDMVCASLQGAFANLKTSVVKTDGQKAGDKGNYFRFTDPLFVDTGKGYMVEYMRSLSLSRSKQYLLASDYVTDAVRAFFVVPVNIALLEGFSADGEYGDFNYDYDGDGDYTIEDFYEYVYEGRWSYDTIAQISNMGFYAEGSQPNPTPNPNGCLHDRLVFALAEDQLSGSGMFYSASIDIIRGELSEFEDGEGNGYVDFIYYYPEDNRELYDFCEALTALMSRNPGVISVDNNETLGYGGGYTALAAIRDRFANDRILFGGVTVLAQLERSEYREMWRGFGIAPVPMFRTEYTEAGATGEQITVKNNYSTAIYNKGKLIGINAKTQKFAKISAYLDFQSMYSTEILDEYYDYKLGENSGSEANTQMLRFIRLNVRGSFEQAYEDAIGRLFATENNAGEGAGSTSEKQKWYAIIMDRHYKIDVGTMAMYYAMYAGEDGPNGAVPGGGKAGKLDLLEASFPHLPA